MFDGNTKVADEWQKLVPSGKKVLIENVDTVAYLMNNGVDLQKHFSTIISIDTNRNLKSVLRDLQNHQIITGDKDEISGKKFDITFFAAQEASVETAHRLELEVATPNESAKLYSFNPPDKLGQRAALDNHGLSDRQPRWQHVDIHNHATLRDAAKTVGYPAILKPVNGGGSLGVHYVTNEHELFAAARENSSLHNYGGGELTGHVLEQPLNGPEVSLQGIVHNSALRTLAVSSKYVERDNAGAYHELGHVAQRVNDTTYGPQVHDLAQQVIHAFGYKNGPIQMDLTIEHDGPKFIEAGFRQSGMAVSTLVNSLHTESWEHQIAANLAHSHLERQPSYTPSDQSIHASLALRSDEEIERAHRLMQSVNDQLVKMEVIEFPKPSPTTSEAQTPLALQALKKQFGYLRGRVFWKVSGDAHQPVVRIYQDMQAITNIRKRTDTQQKPLVTELS
jgi:predicted ATP-grasp superfamily ATP-dependent carboligase